MSVILTAARKSTQKPKSARPKKKRAPPRPASKAVVTPPVSSGSTVVWHWELDDVPTTVMFSKDRGEVWCNGEIMEKVESFADDGSGAVIDFVILITGKVHRGRIKRMSTGARRDGIAYQLFVDGYMILEHTSEALSPYDALTPIEDEAAQNPQFEDFDDYGAGASSSSHTRSGPFRFSNSPPPSYEYLMDEEHKKFK